MPSRTPTCVNSLASNCMSHSVCGACRGSAKRFVPIRATLSLSISTRAPSSNRTCLPSSQTASAPSSPLAPRDKENEPDTANIARSGTAHYSLRALELQTKHREGLGARDSVQNPLDKGKTGPVPSKLDARLFTRRALCASATPLRCGDSTIILSHTRETTLADSSSFLHELSVLLMHASQSAKKACGAVLPFSLEILHETLRVSAKATGETFWIVHIQLTPVTVYKR
jgi:hypothetical protein